MTTNRPGRPEAAAAIWQWQKHPAADDFESAARRGRRRGLVQGGTAMAVGASLYCFWSPLMGTVVCTLGGLIGLSALVSPRGIFAGVEQGFNKLGVWTGRAISWALLVPVFYLFFLPFGRIFRRGSRDRMKRRIRPDAETYWEEHEGPTAASTNLERQY